MENKKTISCTYEEQPLPFGFLLLVASEIGEADFEFCYKKLTNWMLSDESLQSAEAWIEFEAQGNPRCGLCQCQQSSAFILSLPSDH